MIGSKPPTTIVGIEPGEIDFAVGLSPELEARIPDIIELILEEITLLRGVGH